MFVIYMKKINAIAQCFERILTTKTGTGGLMPIPGIHPTQPCPIPVSHSSPSPILAVLMQPQKQLQEHSLQIFL